MYAHNQRTNNIMKINILTNIKTMPNISKVFYNSIEKFLQFDIDVKHTKFYQNYVKNLFKPNYLRYILIFVNVLIIFLMGWARHFKKCHNIIQILGGIVLGGGLASLLFILKKKI